MAELLGVFGFLVVLLRAVILCCQTVAIGGVFFLTVVANTAELRNQELLASCWKLLRRSALALALAQLFFVISNSLVLTASTDISFGEVLGANFVWAGMLAIAAGLLVFFWPASLGENVWLMWLPALGMLAASVMTSHSASRMEDRGMLVSLTALHYLATATWIGGLAYLLFATRAKTSEARVAITRNFSRCAQVSVAVLFLAGLGMSWVYVGTASAIWGTAYGVMLGAKISLFVALLVLGAANFYMVKGMDTDPTGTGAKSLHCFGEAEIGIGLSIILVAASMTSQPPSVDLLQNRVSMHEIGERFEPRMPRFSSPDLKDISESTNEIMKRAAAAGKPLPAAFVPGQSGIGVNTPADIAWSEYNHNCSGFVVFLMGLLALLSRSKYFSWAKIWPLAFLLLAVFLFFRADPENWPMGPNGFWASFAVTDVLQHRAAVVLIIIFAIFQYRVETGRVRSMAAALVFPAVCAVGGVVLLTHTHALSNVKEELLAELSHTPLAVFGIIAGWSRWLELRLPEQNGTRKYLAWVWPVCFILVGLILMDYHEADVRV